MNDFDIFSLPKTAIMAPTAADQADDWRLLRRLCLPPRLNQPGGGTIKCGLIIDVETTGLLLESDEVIQLAMLPFDYELESGLIIDIHHHDAFEEMREPAVGISEEASLITGIRDADVAGKTIDPNIVEELVGAADLVIAHNAQFDRPMVEKLLPTFKTKPWACSLTGVDWLREGFAAGKLDYLGMQFGWFYDGHRALADCEACLALLAQQLPKSNAQVLAMVREAALNVDYLVRAINAPYDARMFLKARGYRWRPAELPNGKVWWTSTSDAAAEIDWLQSEVYGTVTSIPTNRITALNRYSERIWEDAN
jgi:DNA polymerase-3 subunit epsilon